MNSIGSFDASQDAPVCAAAARASYCLRLATQFFQLDARNQVTDLLMVRGQECVVAQKGRLEDWLVQVADWQGWQSPMCIRR